MVPARRTFRYLDRVHYTHFDLYPLDIQPCVLVLHLIPHCSYFVRDACLLELRFQAWTLPINTLLPNLTMPRYIHELCHRYLYILSSPTDSYVLVIGAAYILA